MQHALKLQVIFLLPEYTKLICRYVFYVHMYMQTACLMVNFMRDTKKFVPAVSR